jgi:hypothetical protein
MLVSDPRVPVTPAELLTPASDEIPPTLRVPLTAIVPESVTLEAVTAPALTPANVEVPPIAKVPETAMFPVCVDAPVFAKYAVVTPVEAFRVVQLTGPAVTLPAVTAPETYSVVSVTVEKVGLPVRLIVAPRFMVPPPPYVVTGTEGFVVTVVPPP